MMRPPGPVPLTASRRTPRASAILRASGVDFTRTPAFTFPPAPPPRRAAARARGVRGRAVEPAGRAAGASATGAVGAGEAFGLSPAFSPSFSTSARAAPTRTFPPSGTKMSTSVPSSKDSISMVALSVSTSARMSPTSILSPFFLCQRRRVPSVMVSLNLGIVISGMGVGGRLLAV